MNRSWCNVAISLMCGVFLVFCVSSCNNKDTTYEQQTLPGWVTAESAVAGAAISLYDLWGKPIPLEEEAVTNDTGTFGATVRGLPSHFRVVAGYGTRGGQSFLADLSADCRGFDPETDYVYINLVTTIVSAYLDAHPDATWDEAVSRVKGFLEIPDAIDIGEDLQTQSSWEFFWPYGFLEEAAENGGVSPFIALLIAEMASDDATHPFPQTAGTGGAVDSPGALIAESLVKGATSYVGGQAFGFGLKELGLSAPDATAQGIAELKRQMAAISSQLTEINAKLNTIIMKLDQVDYNSVVGVISPRVSNIISLSKKLAFFYAHTFSSNAARENWRNATIKGIENNIINRDTQDLISDQLIGLSPGATPLLKKWSELIKGSHLLLSARDHTSIQTHFNFFDAVQAFEMLLRAEYHHAKATTVIPYAEDAILKDVIDTYNTNLEKQKKLLLAPIPTGVMVFREPSPNTNKPLMIDESIYYLNYFDADAQAARMNTVSWLTFNNWRKIERNEIDNFFKAKPSSEQHLAYLNKNGWQPPLAGHIYFAARGGFHHEEKVCHGPISFGICQTGWVTENYYIFFMMSVHNAGIWTSSITNESRPEGGAHWLMVRDLADDEMGKYFW